MNELILFISTASLVFLLGVQQLNVHGNHTFLAVITSLLIGGAQIYLWRTIPSASLSKIIAVLAGGPIGIVLAMKLHPILVKIIKSDTPRMRKNNDTHKMRS